MPEDRLLSVREAAQRLGISRSGLFRLLDSGQLAGVRIGRRRLVAESDLRALVQRGREPARPKAASGGDAA